MNLTSKKARAFGFIVVSVVVSRATFALVDDPEGPNLLIVLVLAAIIYAALTALYSFATHRRMR
jgi:hypothetical protein